MRYCFTLLFLIMLLLASQAQQCREICIKKKHFNFKLLKKEGYLIDTAKIRIDGVYVLQNNSTGIVLFIRFFKNGSFYKSCDYCSYPKTSDFNNLKYGSYGNYNVKNNTVKAESYSPYAGYYFRYYSIEDNKIISRYTSNRSWWPKPKLKESPELIYEFKKMELTSKPFW